MENYLGLGVGIIAIISAFLVRSAFFFKTSLSIAIICLIVALTNGFEEDPSLGMICFTLIGMVGAGYFVSLLSEKIRKVAPYFIGFLALIPIGAKANYQGFDVNWTMEVASFAIIGTLIPLLAKIKDWFAIRWFGAEEGAFNTGISLIYFGIFVFASSFFVSTFGVILLATGYFASSLALRSNAGLQLGIVLFSIAWTLFSLNSLEGISDSLLKGNLWMGILVGLGSLWISKSIKNEKSSGVFFSLVIPLLVVGVVVSFGLINENFGGMPTYLGAIIGSSLALALVERKEGEKPFVGIVFPLILIGFTTSIDAVFQPEKLKVETLLDTSSTGTNKSNEKKDVMDIPAIALTDGDAGAWKSILSNSKLEFEVGPPASRTAGAFKEFKTDIQLDKSAILKSLNVEIKSGSLTTFNDIRDESVLSDEFIQSEKYPKITYTSKAIQKVGEDYKITGDLEFVGAKVEVALDLRFVSKMMKDGKEVLVFVGKSVVDRTKHKMTSDSKIGDLVDISFEVALDR
ncbi:YceI family protein [Fluviicola taffensis]|uniref:YceI family protein n=1 Tax=Fluviicola taffensis (strain DSM 16823 / NCIMB 13979 / RW262) TaxID=755732 RepID=F2I9A1_FLUTR|nr:YceI family protein [Fluviicola taffensis]AEA44058.1 YceI family protein [Fluviicola taffensis DSM 16823]